MTTKVDVKPEFENELVLARIIDAPRDKVWRCWTEADLLKQWFTPAPWTTVKAEVDVRPGGSSFVVMADPEGNEYPNPGVYLEVVPNERLVFTDAFTSAWVPSEKPFFTCVLTFEEKDGKTLYVARARHWKEEDRKAHEEMGFHEGWGQVTDQLEKVAQSI